MLEIYNTVRMSHLVKCIDEFRAQTIPPDPWFNSWLFLKKLIYGYQQ